MVKPKEFKDPERSWNICITKPQTQEKKLKTDSRFNNPHRMRGVAPDSRFITTAYSLLVKEQYTKVEPAVSDHPKCQAQVVLTRGDPALTRGFQL